MKTKITIFFMWGYSVNTYFNYITSRLCCEQFLQMSTGSVINTTCQTFLHNLLKLIPVEKRLTSGIISSPVQKPLDHGRAHMDDGPFRTKSVGDKKIGPLGTENLVRWGHFFVVPNGPKKCPQRTK